MCECWACRHRRTRAEWAQVLFTDEKKFRLFDTDCRARIYRIGGERFREDCIIQADRHGCCSVMVWAGVPLHHRTNFIFKDGKLTADRYQNEVLRPEVVSLIRNLGLTFFYRTVHQPTRPDEHKHFL